MSVPDVVKVCKIKRKDSTKMQGVLINGCLLPWVTSVISHGLFTLLLGSFGFRKCIFFNNEFIPILNFLLQLVTLHAFKSFSSLSSCNIDALDCLLNLSSGVA
jgi:hypothetical protein